MRARFASGATTPRSKAISTSRRSSSAGGSPAAPRRSISPSTAIRSRSSRRGASDGGHPAATADSCRTAFPGGYPALVERVGLEQARELHKLARMGNRLLRERIERYAHRLRADPGRGAALQHGGAKQEPRRVLRVHGEEFRHALHALAARARARGACDGPICAMRSSTRNTYAVQPLDVTCGLARACVEQGAQVFEGTPVACARRARRSQGGAHHGGTHPRRSARHRLRRLCRGLAQDDLGRDGADRDLRHGDRGSWASG